MFFMMIEDSDKRLKVERLYYKYRDLMYTVAYEILQDKHLSEDAVQESFIRIIKNLHKIDEQDIMRTKGFLSIICRNVAKDIYVSRMYLNENENAAEEITNENTEGTYDLNEIVINREVLGIVSRAIESLDPIYRDVLLLRRVYGLSREEIADIFGINVETVKKRLARAKTKLIHTLEEEMVYDV